MRNLLFIDNKSCQCGLLGSSEVFEKAGSQVIISYEEASQDIVHKLHTKLTQAGHEVWMAPSERCDLQTYAKAVEEAKVVLVCVSKRYRRSGHHQIGTSKMFLFLGSE